ncbi:MAG TPA: RidA family protein [Micromonosporaceae bacterium]
MTAAPDDNTGNFSEAVRAGDFLFVSGQASVDENGTIVGGDLADEMDRSIANLRRVLAGYGLDLSDVVKVTAYLRDPGDLELYNSLYRRYFAPPRPARTTLTNCLPEDLKFEIDAVAYLPSTRDAS